MLSALPQLKVGHPAVGFGGVRHDCVPAPVARAARSPELTRYHNLLRMPAIQTLLQGLARLHLREAFLRRDIDIAVRMNPAAIRDSLSAVRQSEILPWHMFASELRSAISLRTLSYSFLDTCVRRRYSNTRIEAQAEMLITQIDQMLEQIPLFHMPIWLSQLKLRPMKALIGMLPGLHIAASLQTTLAQFHSQDLPESSHQDPEERRSVTNKWTASGEVAASTSRLFQDAVRLILESSKGSLSEAEMEDRSRTLATIARRIIKAWL